jgi:hypothetical protein
VVIHEDRLHVSMQEEFEEIQRGSEGVDRQSCPWAVRHHHESTSRKILDMGEKERGKIHK